MLGQDRSPQITHSHAMIRTHFIYTFNSLVQLICMGELVHHTNLHALIISHLLFQFIEQ